MIKFPKFNFKISLPQFKSSLKSCLGIDIGTSLIKIVSLAKSGNRIKLENYGETSALTLYEKPFRTFDKNTLYLSTPEIAKALRAILEEGNIRIKDAFFSIPDFSSFFTNFELPPMAKDEISQAIQFEAPQHIPLPLSEVATDWQLIGNEAKNKKREKLRVLLVAVPHEVINQYQEIAMLCGLNLYGFEAEAFSLRRTFIKNLKEKDAKSITALVDIGAQSTSCSIIEEGVLKISHSFDIAGNELTQVLAKSLSIDYEEANDLKKRYGVSFLNKASEGPILLEKEKNPQKISQTLVATIDSILIEIERIFQGFQQAENKKVQKIVLSGGGAMVPGLLEYFSSYLKIEAGIIDPFANIFYPPVLEKYLREVGSSYAIAVGAAMRALE